MIATLLGLTLALPTQVDPGARRAYAEILDAHVKEGRVDYAAIEKEDLPKLDRYLEAVAKATLPKGRDARVAFYVDAYNALVIRSVIRNGRPRSVLDVDGFFDEQTHVVAKRKLTLDAIEKKHLNPYAKDPRTHFVLVCAAVGCPVLEREPYAGGDLDARFERATRRYLASPTGARVKPGRLELSKIFDWYAKDFGGKDGAVAFVTKRLPEAERATLGADPAVGYIDYNWTLNQR